MPGSFRGRPPRRPPRPRRRGRRRPRDDDDAAADDDDDAADDDDSTPLGPCSEELNLEIVPLDIWGQDLAWAEMEFLHDGAPFLHLEEVIGPTRVPLPGPGDVRVDLLESDEFLLASVRLSWDGGALPDTLTLTQPAAASGARAVHAYSVVMEGDVACPTATVFLGADHAWFAATARPARHDNDLTLLLNGQDTWSSVHGDLLTAEDHIHHSVWFWVSDFELVRPDGHAMSTESERNQYAALTVLEEQPVRKRLLVNRFYDGWDWIDYLYTDWDLLDHAETPGDEFEVILHPNTTDVPLVGEYEGEPADFCFRDRVLANPLYAGVDLLDPPCHDPATRDYEVPAASWHQKFWLVDDRVAYLGGMNTKSVDWDTDQHLVFDHRRMAFDADRDDRLDVLAREELPDYGPRRDYMIRIDGPMVTDVDELFHTRWEQARLTDAAYSENTTPFDPAPYSGDSPGNVYAQLNATMPEPWAEMSILESMAKAITEAEEYIFIEDQYFRAPALNDYLIATLLDKPQVELIVVSKPVADYDGGAKYTYLSDQLFRDLVPDQYLMLQLKTFDVVLEEGTFWDTRDLYFEDIDTHSKLLIVDDRYMSVGSANKNNRALLYDGELNVAILDEEWVRAERTRLFQNLVGPERASQVSDDPDANFDLFAEVAELNDQLQDDWEIWIDEIELEALEDLQDIYRPDGFVYTLEIEDSYWWDVGPDMF